MRWDYVALAVLVLGGIFAFFPGPLVILYYAIEVAVFIWILAHYYKYFNLDKWLIISLLGIAVLHLMGVTLSIGHTRLYDYWLLSWFRYDNLVHFYSIFVVTIMAHRILRPRFKIKSSFIFYMILILVSLGIGAVVEIFELMLVYLPGAGGGVGDYMNNALDLVYNLLGSLAACLFIGIRRSR